MRFFSGKKKPEPEKAKPRPIDTFFHLFILDTIHKLPNEKKEIIKKNDLDKVY